MLRKALAVLTGATLLAAAPASADGVATYRVNADSIYTLSITACGPRVEVYAVGDGDTALGFYLYHPDGTLGWYDNNGDDVAGAVITTGLNYGSCRVYTMRIVNQNPYYYNNVQVGVFDR